MGQYWKILNIDKAQNIENHGGLKLWEILVNFTAEPLVDLPKVPQLCNFKFSEASLAAAKSK